eukprot:1160522-Pelagomonas_calceolata.AAC.3
MRQSAAEFVTSPERNKGCCDRKEGGSAQMRSFYISCTWNVSCSKASVHSYNHLDTVKQSTAEIADPPVRDKGLLGMRGSGYPSSPAGCCEDGGRSRLASGERGGRALFMAAIAASAFARAAAASDSLAASTWAYMNAHKKITEGFEITHLVCPGQCFKVQTLSLSAWKRKP